MQFKLCLAPNNFDLTKWINGFINLQSPKIKLHDNQNTAHNYGVMMTLQILE